MLIEQNGEEEGAIPCYGESVNPRRQTALTATVSHTVDSAQMNTKPAGRDLAPGQAERNAHPAIIDSHFSADRALEIHGR